MGFRHVLANLTLDKKNLHRRAISAKRSWDEVSRLLNSKKKKK